MPNISEDKMEKERKKEYKKGIWRRFTEVVLTKGKGEISHTPQEKREESTVKIALMVPLWISCCPMCGQPILKDKVGVDDVDGQPIFLALCSDRFGCKWESEIIEFRRVKVKRGENDG